MKAYQLILISAVLSLFSSTILAVPHNQVMAKPYEPRAKVAASTANKKAKKHQSHLKTKEEINYVTQLQRKLTQDLDNPQPKYYWFDKRLGMAGLINVDLQDQTHPQFRNPRSDKIHLGPTKFNLAAKVNDWVRARVGLFYSTNADYYYPAASTTNNIDFDEGYIEIGDLQKKPFYFRAGKQYLPFGKYHRFPILRPVTQQLSETRDVSAQLGVVDTSGLYGSLFIFNGVAKATSQSHDTLNNFGAALGYENFNHALGVNAGVDYLNNMIDVGAIQNGMLLKNYTQRVHAFSAHLDLLSGPFDFNLRYVTALRAFSANDFQYTDSRGNHGAHPRAAAAMAGYQFKTKGHDSKIVLSYQLSREAYNTNGANNALQLPQSRLSAGYGINILRNTIIAFEYDRDRDYSRRNGGGNGYNNRATVRLTVLV